MHCFFIYMLQIIDSVDSPVLTSQKTEKHHNILGMCHSFYLRSFTIPSSPIPKVLMFFDGCATHLGCTVILRGSSNNELRRVKRVMYFFIYALFNWQLEKSFLMDEFASVPGSERIVNSLSENVSTDAVHFREQTVLNHNEVSSPNLEAENESTSIDFKAKQNDLFHKREDFDPLIHNAFSLEMKKSPSDSVTFPLSSKLDVKTRSDSGSTERDQNINNIALVFKDILSKTVLSACPFMKYEPPYLLSQEGQCCPLRKFFPEQLYFSPFLSSKVTLEINRDVENPRKTCHRSTVRFKPMHSFVHQKITTGMNDLSLRSALADFRAKGCTIQRICHCERDEEDSKDFSIDAKESQLDEGQLRIILSNFRNSLCRFI